MYNSFGTCAPYSGLSPLCNNYINSSSYVYTLDETSQFLVSGQINRFGIAIDGEESTECRDLVSRIICNYYFAPCGNSISGAHLPLSLCQDQCDYVMEICSNLWMRIDQEIMQQTNLDAIICNDISRHFQNLPTCCSDFGIRGIVQS